MSLHPAVQERLDRLAPDQRAAATAPPGPVLCVAPAGSGKTTTLVARVAWLVEQGTDPQSICALTFNRRAAEELRDRLAAALEPLGVGAGSMCVRTFHALGRQILLDAGASVEPLLDRPTLLREVLGPDVDPAALRRLDDAFSRLKLDLRVGRAPPTTPPTTGGPVRAIDPWVEEAFRRYEAALADRGGLDHDDLVARALDRLERDEALLTRWRARCGELLVDEVQDVDRSQLRLALLLAAPGNRIFLVGDDDQTIYAWRLADVRRVLGLAAALPGMRRTDLVTNYRCPPAVVERAVRLVGHNQERFAKLILARPGATGVLRLAPDSGDDVARARRLLRAWQSGGGTRAVLTRTNAELAPYAAVCLELGLPYRAVDDGLTLDDGLEVPQQRASQADERDGDPATSGEGRRALLAGLAARAARDSAARTLLPWAPAARDAQGLAALVADARRRRAALRRDDALLVLATVHGTKGLEFDHVAVVNLDEGRFPHARSLAEAPDPGRQRGEERRLAYVAWTRARRSLTLLYDPGSPSPFLREAFSAAELTAP